MKLAAIIKARAVALVESDELNIKGHIRLPDVVPAIVKRYRFLSFPTKVEDFDFEKGVKFSSGKHGDTVIDSMSIFPGIVTLESLSSTADSKAALEDVFRWGRDEIGLTYTDGMIAHWGYISQITFTTEFPLLNAISTPLTDLARKTGEYVDSLFGEGLPYEVTRVNVGHDPLKRKSGIAGVSIEHRANVQFGENKFFSEAPLPTDVHIRFLEEFEAAVRESIK